MAVVWKDDVEEELLSVREAEIEELDSDQLTANEAAFLEGYEAFDEY
ncbi:hypothetical protein J4470_03930 [Candidatus Woesearchaeota archaeon]|nr:hypothetical protein [Candidatus Woesearchaeota archaeon]